MLLCCLNKCSYAVEAIFVIHGYGPNPSPTKVFDQLGQRCALVIVTGNGSEKSGVLLPVAQTGTGSKMAYLQRKKQSKNNFAQLIFMLFKGIDLPKPCTVQVNI